MNQFEDYLDYLQIGTTGIGVVPSSYLEGTKPETFLAFLQQRGYNFIGYSVTSTYTYFWCD